VVLVEPVLDCALVSLDGGVDPAALCELASGAVPGVLVAGWLALWSLCGMLPAEDADEDSVPVLLPLVPDALWSGVVLLVDGVVLLAPAALWSVDDGALGELEEAEGVAPPPLSHLSEIICTLSTLMVS